MPNALLSVVIVSFNTREMTLDCLRVLSSEIDGIDAETFVVDNGSTDGSAEAVQHGFPGVHLIANQRNMGFGAANNQALRLAQGEFFLLLNSDAFPRPGAIRCLLERAEANPRAAVIGPRLLNEDGTLQPSAHRFPSPVKSIWENTLLTAALPNHPVFGDYRKWPHDQEQTVDFVIGACWLVRREAVETVGLFDEDFFLYSEETDWAKRFQQAGWSTIFTPAAEVVHLAGGSGKEQSERVFCEFHRGQERFLQKHYGALGLLVYRTTTATGALLRIFAFSIASICIAKQRARFLPSTKQWKRILRWTLGIRGIGLQEG